MKKLLTILSVFACISAFSQAKISIRIPAALPRTTPFVVSTLSELSAYADSSPVLVVKDTIRGGLFNLLPSSAGLTVDNGITFQLSDGRYAVRDLSQATGVKPEWFGAIPDGTTDCHDAIVAASTAAYGKTLFFGHGTYKVNSLINIDLINTNWIGQDSSTVITGSFGYAIIQFGDIKDASLQNITFRTSYTNATLDQGSAVVFSYQQDVSNLKVLNCTFKAPTANTSGLVFYANITSPVTSHIIQNLEISHCVFDSLGAIGCTLMNRTSYDSLAMNIQFNSNVGSNLGLGGNYGFILSLDGAGQQYDVNYNKIRNALGIGIENTGWDNGNFIGNTFGNFARVYDPFSFSSSNSAMNYLSISNNTVVGTSSGRCNFIGVNNSTFQGNYFVTSDNPGVSLRDASNNSFIGETYGGTDYALLVGNTGVTTQKNSFTNCTFTTSATTNSSTVRFQGASTTSNIVMRCNFFKGTGGIYTDEITSATGNKLYINNYDATLTSTTATSPHEYGFSNTTMDADNIVLKNLAQTITQPKTYSIAANSALIVGGTWIATDASQSHVIINPHITGDAVVGEQVNALSLLPQLTAGANSQILTGLNITGTFTDNSFTSVSHVSVGINNGDISMASGAIRNSTSTVSGTTMVMGAADNSWGWQLVNAGSPTSRNKLQGRAGSAVNINLDPFANASIVNYINTGGAFGINTTTGNAALHIGTPPTNKPAILIDSAGLLGSVPSSGSIEFTGTGGHFYGTVGTSRYIFDLGNLIPGTTTNDNATAGNIGEYVSSLIASGSAVSLTTATGTNVTSISLTAGDWDVSGNISFAATTATVTGTSGGVTSTSATVPTDGSEVYSGVQVTLLSENDGVTLPRKRFSLSGTTTVYLVGKCTFSAGSVSAFGSITARRVR